MKAISLENWKSCKALAVLIFFVLALQVGLSNAWASDLVKKVQEALVEKGYDPGPVDGMWGSKTRAGLVKFQESEGLSASGELDGETKNRLLSSSGDSSSMGGSAPAAAVQSPPASSAERVPEGVTGPDVPDSEIVWGRHK